MKNIKVYWPIAILGLLLMIWGILELWTGGPIHFLIEYFPTFFSDICFIVYVAGLGFVILSLVPTMMKERDSMNWLMGLFLLFLGGILVFGPGAFFWLNGQIF